MKVLNNEVVCIENKVSFNIPNSLKWVCDTDLLEVSGDWLLLK